MGDDVCVCPDKDGISKIMESPLNIGDTPPFCVAFDYAMTGGMLDDGLYELDIDSLIKELDEMGKGMGGEKVPGFPAGPMMPPPPDFGFKPSQGDVFCTDIPGTDIGLFGICDPSGPYFHPLIHEQCPVTCGVCTSFEPTPATEFEMCQCKLDLWYSSDFLSIFLQCDPLEFWFKDETVKTALEGSLRLLDFSNVTPGESSSYGCDCLQFDLEIDGENLQDRLLGVYGIADDMTVIKQKKTNTVMGTFKAKKKMVVGRRLQSRSVDDSHDAVDSLDGTIDGMSGQRQLQGLDESIECDVEVLPSGQPVLLTRLYVGCESGDEMGRKLQGATMGMEEELRQWKDRTYSPCSWWPSFRHGSSLSLRSSRCLLSLRWIGEYTLSNVSLQFGVAPQDFDADCLLEEGRRLQGAVGPSICPEDVMPPEEISTFTPTDDGACISSAPPEPVPVVTNVDRSCTLVSIPTGSGLKRSLSSIMTPNSLDDVTDQQIVDAFKEGLSQATGIPPSDIIVNNINRDGDAVSLSCFILYDGNLVQISVEELEGLLSSAGSLSDILGLAEPFSSAGFPFSIVCLQELTIEPSPTTCKECYDAGYEQGQMDCEPTTTGAVTSDPHVSGLQNQSFDFTGEADSYYALISDESFAVNARFATAYTTGLTIDPETLMTSPMRQQGTWLSAAAVILGSHTIALDIAESPLRNLCPHGDDKVSCFFGGSVTIDGEPAIRVGIVPISRDISVSLVNQPSFGR
eukprot:scaffold1383_cov360-Prasinococcus_capsulatus_cf.AAC.1